MHSILLADEKDISDIALLLKNAKSDWHLKIVEDCFSELYRNYIFLENKKTVGFLCIKKNMDFVELLQICVDPLYQRQKIATRLLSFLIAEINMPIQLEVRESNSKAIALYEKSGFVKVGVRKKYYSNGEDAILMDFLKIVS